MKNKIFSIFVLIVLIFLSIIIIDKNINSINFSSIAYGNKIMMDGIDSNQGFTWLKDLEFENVNWLFDNMIAVIYNNYGLIGIYLFYIILTSFIAFIIYYILVRQGNSQALSVIISILTIIIAKNIFNNGILSITLLLCILDFFFIEKLLETGKKKYIAFMIIVTILLTNINATAYPILYLLLLPFMLESQICKFRFINTDDKVIIKKNDNSFLLFIATILIFICGAINPLSWSPYLNLFKALKIFNNNIFYNLGLMKSINIYASLYVIIPLLIIILSKTKIRFVDLTFFILLPVLIFYNFEFLYLYIFILVIPMTRIITEFMKTYKYKSNNFIRNILLSTVVLSIFILSIFTIKDNNNKEYIDNSKNPVLATDYIVQNYNAEDIKIFNSPEMGSYMEFMGVPVLIDDRKEMYFNRFNNVEVFYDWYDVYTGKMNFDEMLYKYDIEYALLKNDDIINNYIADYENYEKIFEDDDFSLYKRDK